MKAKKKAVKKIKKSVFGVKQLQRVAEGIKFLDFVVGRKVWLKRMDMKKFDINLGYQCVAGNVFRDAGFEGATDGYDSFKAAVDALGGDEAQVRFGFYDYNETKMQQLQDIWVREITKMKKQARIK